MSIPLLLLLLILPATLCADAPEPQPLKHGSNIYVEQEVNTFPDLHLYDASGERHRLSDHRGQLVLLNVWATWCAPCIEEMPQLVQLQERFPERLRVIALSEDRKGFDTITPFVQQHGLGALTHYQDKGGREFRKLRIRGLPISFLIDARGRLIATIQGVTNWQGDAMTGLIEQYSP
jgi:thiol-disulfide isomerase/thioredoxin